MADDGISDGLSSSSIAPSPSVVEEITPAASVITIPAMMTLGEKPARTIILFDGVCNVCHTFVSFVYPRDKNKRFYFQAMQSKKGREILADWGIAHNLNTVILIDEASQCYYTHSTAIFNILKDLHTILTCVQQPWSYAYYLIYLPQFLRDFGYTTFASVRYAIFGKKDECTFYPGLKDRFIDWRSPIVEIEDSGKDM